MEMKQERLNHFLGKMVNEMGAAFNGALTLMGYQREVVTSGGLTRFRCATQTPPVFEAKL